MNTWNIAGYVGSVKDLKSLGSDVVLNFSVAVNERINGKDETLWVDCSLWGKRAEALAPHIKKGAGVSLSGRAGCREHDGKAYMKLRVFDLTFIGGGKQEGDAQPRQGRRQQRNEPPAGGIEMGRPQPGEFDEDEIPFE